VVLDLLSLTEETAMWQKSVFAKREGGLVQLQGDFGFRQSNIQMKREGRVIVVTRGCSTLVVDEFVNRLLHGTLKR